MRGPGGNAGGGHIVSGGGRLRGVRRSDRRGPRRIAFKTVALLSIVGPASSGHGYNGVVRSAHLIQVAIPVGCRFAMANDRGCACLVVCDIIDPQHRGRRMQAQQAPGLGIGQGGREQLTHGGDPDAGPARAGAGRAGLARRSCAWGNSAAGSPAAPAVPTSPAGAPRSAAG